MYERSVNIKVRAQSTRDGGRSVHVTVPVGARSSLGFGVVIPGELLAMVRQGLCRFVAACAAQPPMNVHARAHLLAQQPGADVQAVMDQLPGVEVDGWRFRRALRDAEVGHGMYPPTMTYPYVGAYIGDYHGVGDAALQAGQITGQLLGALGPALSSIPGAGPGLAAGAGAISSIINAVTQQAAAAEAANARAVGAGAAGAGAALEAAARAAAARAAGNAPSPAGSPGMLIQTTSAPIVQPTPALSAAGPLPNLAAALGSGVQGAPTLAGAEVLGQALNTLLSTASLREQLDPQVARTLSTALRAMETTAGAALGNARAREVLRAARIQTANEVARGMELARLITAP